MLQSNVQQFKQSFFVEVWLVVRINDKRFNIPINNRPIQSLSTFPKNHFPVICGQIGPGGVIRARLASQGPNLSSRLVAGANTVS
jgi:hypothetical protein